MLLKKRAREREIAAVRPRGKRDSPLDVVDTAQSYRNDPIAQLPAAHAPYWLSQTPSIR
jgi:hypothetical protein